ncbi:hypothetical protein C8R43DRAFT_816731, partial [Mycena crocata]
MRLKSYLELDPEKRATWAYLADSTIAKHGLDQPRVKKGTHINTFLQTWSPKRSALPARLKDMMNVARKYGVTFDTHNPSQKIRRNLPLWHHFGEDPGKRRINNADACVCLRLKHGAKTMGDAERISAWLSDRRHRAHKDCRCLDCVDDRAFMKCKNPHGCAKMAQTKLDSLQRKWDPRVPDLAIPDRDDPNPEEEVIFTGPPKIENLTDGFRIFTKERKHLVIGPPPPPKIRQEGGQTEKVISLASAIRRGGQAEALAGAGIWCGAEELSNHGKMVPAELDQSLAGAEIIAALQASREFTP